MNRHTRHVPRIRAAALLATALAWLALSMAAPAMAPAQPGPDEPDRPDQPAGEPDANATLRELVAQLGADSHIQRKRAEARLLHIGRPALPMLMDALAGSDDAEITFRVQSILTAIGEDFLVLCAHLSDRNPRVRAYAEESLALRLLGRNDDGGPRVVPVNEAQDAGALLHSAVQYAAANMPRRATPLMAQRLNFREDFTGSPADLLLRDEAEMPVVIMPEAWGHPALHEPLTLPRAEVSNLEQALTVYANQRGIAYSQVQLGPVPVLAVGLASSDRRLASQRDVALGLCECTLHDLPEARSQALHMLGLIYGGREPVSELLVNCVRLENNPLRNELLAGLVLSGQPMDALLGNVPEWAAAVVQRQLGDANATWLERMAASRALVTWVPREPRAGTIRTARQRQEHEAALQRYAAARDAFSQFVVPGLIARAGGDEPVAAYLAVWALGALRDGYVAADRDKAVAAVAGALASEHAELARQALQALAWLAPSPPPEGTLTRALELGFAADDEALRASALEYLRRSRSPEVFAAVLARYREVVTDGTRNLRLFLAKLLGDATDTDTLIGVLELAAVEQDDSIASEMLRAFTAEAKDLALWPALLKLLTSDDLTARQRGARVVIAAGLPDREERVRGLLDAATDATRRMQLQILLFRLGDDGLLPVLMDVFNGDDEPLACEAAAGLGETMSDEVLDIFKDAFNSDKVTTRLAALHGLDAWGRACAAAGNVEKVSQAYQTLFNFSRDPSEAVRNLARNVRNNYASGQSGYRRQAERARSATGPETEAASYAILPVRPHALISLAEDLRQEGDN